MFRDVACFALHQVELERNRYIISLMFASRCSLFQALQVNRICESSSCFARISDATAPLNASEKLFDFEVRWPICNLFARSSDCDAESALLGHEIGIVIGVRRGRGQSTPTVRFALLAFQ